MEEEHLPKLEDDLRLSDDDGDGTEFGNLFKTADPDTHMFGVTARRTSGRAKKAPERFESQTFASRPALTGMSVFDDDSMFNQRRRKKKGGLSVKQLVRNKAARNRQSKELEELRQDAMKEGGSEGDPNDEGIALIAAMAKKEDAEEELRLLRLRKYQAPVPLFTGQPHFPTRRRKLRVVVPDPYTDLLCTTDEDGDMVLDLEALQYLDETAIRFCIDDTEGEPNSLVGSKLFRSLFEAIAYDKSAVVVKTVKSTTVDARAGSADTKTGSSDAKADSSDDTEENLQGIFEALLYMLERWPSLIHTFPNLSRVLATLGGDISTSDDFEVKSDEQLEPGSKHYNIEDDYFENAPGQQNPLTRILSRNLGRVFQLFATALKSQSRKGPQVFTESQTMSLIHICVRVMISKFGAQFAKECGLIIAYLLDLVPQEKWPSFRLQVAKRIASVTDRLYIQIELISATNLSILTKRSRCLCLECGYLIFYQWSGGPAHDPSPRSFDELKPSVSAESKGLQRVSFVLGDVLKLFSQLPDINDKTDVAWLSGVAQVFQLAVCDLEVLTRRSEQDLAKLMSLCGLFRKSFSRLAFCVEINVLKIAIDAVTGTVKELFALNKDARKEVDKNAEPKQAQRTILDMFGRKNKG